MERVLIIAAHPDDEVLGCGGFISKYKPLGIDFKIHFIGEGSSCRFKDPACDEAVLAIEERNKAASAAMLTLGIKDYEFHDLPCGRFDQVPIIEINKIIEKAINDFEPDTVLTHSQNDLNNDHQITCSSTMMATRPGALNAVSKVFSYEVLSSSEWSFNRAFSPNYFEKLTSDDIDNKIQALSCYESEVRAYPFPRSTEGVRAHAMVRGMQAGYEYAEAFYLIRELKL